MHLWQNPCHMNKSEFWKRNTRFQRFLRPFRGRGPSISDGNKRNWDCAMKCCSQVLCSSNLYTLIPSFWRVVQKDEERVTSSSQSCGEHRVTISNLSQWFFNATPKKLNGMVVPRFAGEPQPDFSVGWALYFQEEFSIPPAFFWFLAFYMAACVTFLVAVGSATSLMNVILGIPALILTATTFLFAVVQKNCECASKSRVPS